MKRRKTNHSDLPPFVEGHVYRYMRNLLSVRKLTHRLLYLTLSAFDDRTVGKFTRIAKEYVAHRRASTPDRNDCFMRPETGLEGCTDALMEAAAAKFQGMSEAKLKSILMREVTGMAAFAEEWPRLRELQQTFLLNECETDLIAFAFCREEFEPLGKLCEEICLTTYLNVVAHALAVPLDQLLAVTSRRNRLVRSGIIDDIKHNGTPPIRISDGILCFLSGIDGIPLAERFFCEDRNRTFRSAESCVPAESRRIVEALLRADVPCHILLYGVPGTGKTEFARAIAMESGSRVFHVKHDDIKTVGCDKGETTSRRLALMATVNSVEPKGATLIVDEADTLLNTDYRFVGGNTTGPDKGWVNEFLDTCRHKVIWISNDTSCMEQSTLRRFAFSIGFTRSTRSSRLKWWRHLARSHPCANALSDDFLSDLAGRYAVNTGGIATTLNALSSVCKHPEASAPVVQATLRELVRRHAQAIGESTASKTPVQRDLYDPATLHTDVDIDDVLCGIRAMAQQSPAGSWDLPTGLNLLFWGRPGTGKTAFAQHLADELNRDLVVKRASDLLSKWVGGTEQNIAQSFSEAADTGAVLLIDEADSLFLDRRTATRSWELTQSTELMTQMESFGGVLICCTNMLDKLDGAVLRRFAWKIEFRPIKPEHRIDLCRKYFADAGHWDPDTLARLDGMAGLTFGDIKAVWQRMVMAGSRTSGPEAILSALEAELRYKTGTRAQVGFNS